MNSLLVLRKSASSKRVTLASLTQQALRLLHPNNHLPSNEHFIAGNVHNFSTSTSDNYNDSRGISSSKVPVDWVPRRDFHAGGFLNVGASLGLSQAAGLAVADLSDEDSKSGVASNDEGLEISKLGISDEIVSALSKKGITKLFPIQVFGPFFFIFFIMRAFFRL